MEPIYLHFLNMSFYSLEKDFALWVSLSIWGSNLQKPLYLATCTVHEMMMDDHERCRMMGSFFWHETDVYKFIMNVS